MGAELDFSGMGELIDELDRMVDNTNKVLNDALKAGAEPILKEMKSTTAFEDKSGGLRKSLKVGKVKTSKTRGKYVQIGDVDRKAPHSWYLEYGTSKMKARPFMAPALERRKEEAQEIIKDKLKEALK